MVKMTKGQNASEFTNLGKSRTRKMITQDTPNQCAARPTDKNRLQNGLANPRKSLVTALVELLGPGSVEKMIAAFGGTRIWVPVRCIQGAQLTQLLGTSAASALCARFGGDYLQVPNTLSTEDVYLRIAELHRQGCKINDIALAVGRSRRTVFRLLRKKITDLPRHGGLAIHGKSVR